MAIAAAAVVVVVVVDGSGGGKLFTAMGVGPSGVVDVVTTGCDFKAVIVTPLEVGAETGVDENVFDADVDADVGGGGWCGCCGCCGLEIGSMTKFGLEMEKKEDRFLFMNN